MRTCIIRHSPSNLGPVKQIIAILKIISMRAAKIIIYPFLSPFHQEIKLYYLNMLHIPRKDKAQGKKLPCVIYEPGLGGSRVDMSRGPWLGDALSTSNGCICLRYDSTGSGVSEDFRDVTWEQRYQDLKSAIEYLESIRFADISKIIIVSYSAGAKVAC